MANTIIIKRSSTASDIPTAGQLVEGELAIATNPADRKLYSKDSGGTVFEIGGGADLTADETVSGTWTLDGPVTAADFGTGGKVKDGLDNAQPIGFNVMPVYEIDVDDTFDLAHNGMLWHRDAGTAVNFTCDNDANIPVGATYVVHNEGTDSIEITAGTASVQFIQAGAAPVSGSVTVDQGGLVTVYKYADGEFWVWGDVSAVPLASLGDLNDVTLTTPADASLLIYDTGTAQWRDFVMSGDATMTDAGVVTVANNSHTHTLSNISDVTATATEVNLLDLAGLTAGWVLSADTASTASWKAPSGGSTVDGDTDGQMLFWDETTDQRYEPSTNMRYGEPATIPTLSFYSAGGVTLEGSIRATTTALQILDQSGTIAVSINTVTDLINNPVRITGGTFDIANLGYSQYVRFDSQSTSGVTILTGASKTGLVLSGLDLGFYGQAVASKPAVIAGASLIWGCTDGNSEALYNRGPNLTAPLDNVHTATWRFNTPTGAADPAATLFRLNSATPASVTEIYIDDTDALSEDGGWFLDNIEVGDILSLRTTASRNKYGVYSVDSVTDNTGWWTLGVTVLSAGSTIYANTDHVQFELQKLSQAAGPYLLDTTDTFTGTLTVTGTVAATTLTGAGSGITSLTAANISSGNLGSGVLPYTALQTGSANYKIPFLNTTGATAGNFALQMDNAATMYFNPSSNTFFATNVTGTNIGGITQANLVDKSANEVVSGEWSVPSIIRGKVANYTLVLGDAGQTVRFTGSTAAQTFTIPANASVAFPIGTMIGFENDGSVSISLAITTDTLTWSKDNTTGTRTLAAGASAVIKKTTSTTWKVSGSALVT